MFSFTPARVGAIARYFAASVCAPFASAASSSIAAGISTAAGQQQQQQQTHFDLVVIGGGSGGLACAQQAAALGQRVACLDFVSPSPMGSTWGLGGTCVNVGCIPKKLMHHASVLGDARRDAVAFGWSPSDPTHSWATLVSAVQQHIKSLNFSYRSSLRSAGVEYINAHGSFNSPSSVTATYATGAKRELTFTHAVIAVGSRPKYPGIPGDLECCITSDDVFTLPRAPGRTLVVGGGYVALECAGLLSGLGHPVTLMHRSDVLKGDAFDRDCVTRVVEFMKSHGVNFVSGCVPLAFAKQVGGGGAVAVKYKVDNVAKDAEFDTVLIATGRSPLTQSLNLAAAGVNVSASGHILPPSSSPPPPGGSESTTNPNVFAVGDVMHARPELTPTAIAAGRMLAKRLYDGSDNKVDYDTVPTAVFTPVEYASVGLSQQAAEKKLGVERVDAYHTALTPLESELPLRHDAPPPHGHHAAYLKVVVDTEDFDRVVGIHMVAPAASEAIQGFALAMKKGLHKRDLDLLVGVHPTVTEAFMNGSLEITKSSGKDPKSKGC